MSRQLVVCVANEGYEASLEKHGLLRVIDESGEDYLYPKTFFHSIALSHSAKKAVLAAA